jgi:hypothetical protein
MYILFVSIFNILLRIKCAFYEFKQISYVMNKFLACSNFIVQSFLKGNK